MGAKGATPRPWQRLFENADEAIVLLDRHQRIVFVNASATKLLGIGSGDLIGSRCRPKRALTGVDSADVFAEILSIPNSVHHGHACHARRLLHWSGQPVDIDFIPLSPDGCRCGVVLWLRPAGSVIDAPVDSISCELVALQGGADRRYDLGHFPAFSKGARRVADQVRLAARTDSPVLFRGEKGAGKSWLARALHQLSPRRDQAWLHLDCERLPPGALVRALEAWGHWAGQGSGTIYLDQVHCLPRELQADMGSWRQAVTLSPRIIAGTDVDTRAAVAAGHLLEDFAEWLGLLEITVPPLRERAEDLPAWLEQLARRLGHLDLGQGMHLVDTTKSLLVEYPWAGNLDEMLEVVEEIGPMTCPVEPAQLPARLRRTAKMRALEPVPAERRMDLDQVLAEVERRLLRQALSRTRGNKSRAAELLGIWRARLIRRMQALGMSVDEEDRVDANDGPDDFRESAPECAPDN
jgi:transcriptional regulator with PAS, ATPase and Fis domain